MTSIFIAKQMQQKALITTTNWECSAEPCFFVGCSYPGTVWLIQAFQLWLLPTHTMQVLFEKFPRAEEKKRKVFFFHRRIDYSTIFSLLKLLRKNGCKRVTNRRTRSSLRLLVGNLCTSGTTWHVTASTRYSWLARGRGFAMSLLALGRKFL